MGVLDMEKAIDHHLCLAYFVNPGKLPSFRACLYGTTVESDKETVISFSFFLLFFKSYRGSLSIASSWCQPSVYPRTLILGPHVFRSGPNI